MGKGEGGCSRPLQGAGKQVISFSRRTLFVLAARRRPTLALSCPFPTKRAQARRGGPPASFVGDQASMREQHAARRLGHQMLRHTAEDEFAEARMAIGAGDDQARADIRWDLVESAR